ncbi:MAG TPA: hypothetical protein VH079_16385, partial [Terriglobales bacterium]|nr:hypothetical protein [Terriglobales bacterium]
MPACSEPPSTVRNQIGRKAGQPLTCPRHATISYPIEDVLRTRDPGCPANIRPEPSQLNCT